MKKNQQLSLFGLSTLLTVFILLILLMLATLSLKTALNVQKSLDRSYQVIQETYTLESSAEHLFAQVQAIYQTEGLEAVLKQFPEIEYTALTQELKTQVSSKNTYILLTWKITETGLLRTQVQLKMDSQQDYTNNGDAVYGG